MRDLEARLRRRASAIMRLGRRRGWRPGVIARSIGIDSDVLSGWERDHVDRLGRGPDDPPQSPRPLGRAPFPEPPELVRAMRHLCHLFGPALGARSLHQDCPDASWRTCLDITRQCRLELREQLRDSRAHALTWTAAGTVWAADVWQPDCPIDGQFRYVLDVRDLATGFMVVSEPLERADADSIAAVFDRLYRQFGAPLVCKTDNGSEFTGAGAWEVHHRYGVEQLLSPVELPSYNGACEAGHGSIRYRAELLARRDGRPGDWSLNHLAGARDWANDLVESRRPIPASTRFAARQTISDQQRMDFRRAVLANKQRRCDDLRQRAAHGRRTITIAQPSITRPAIADALRDLGYLTHRSVPIRQPIPWLKTGDISL